MTTQLTDSVRSNEANETWLEIHIFYNSHLDFNSLRNIVIQLLLVWLMMFSSQPWWHYNYLYCFCCMAIELDKWRNRHSSNDRRMNCNSFSFLLVIVSTFHNKKLPLYFFLDLIMQVMSMLKEKLGQKDKKNLLIVDYR